MGIRDKLRQFVRRHLIVIVLVLALATDSLLFAFLWLGSTSPGAQSFPSFMPLTFIAL